MNIRNCLAACGIALMVTAGAAACSSASSGSAGSSGSTAGSGSTGGSGSTAGSGSSPSTGSSLPSWAKSFGSGVQVIPPGSTSPDNNTPADVVVGLVDAIKARNYKGICQYYEPSQQSTCEEMSQALGSALKSLGTIKPSYTVIDGAQALVGATGTVCDSSTNKCSTNNDPAAILDSGKSFSQLWKLAGASSDAYAPIPVVKLNGKWYGATSGA